MDPDQHHNALNRNQMLHWYEIKSILGQGGFGITYLARDTNLDRLFAIKEYLPVEFSTRDSTDTVQPISENHSEVFNWGKRRFLDEAKTLAQFNHPNIIRVHSFFENNNTGYMVMEYEEGTDLGQLIKSGEKFDQDRLLGIVTPILDGLELVHAQGFIHRDIKPPNLFIRGDGSPVLIDFGSARQALGGQTRTMTSLVTPGYAPFEQYHDGEGKQGPWTDIYALGATLYCALTGKPPVESLKRGLARVEHNVDAYLKLSDIGLDSCSDQFLRAVDCALAFGATERPQDVSSWKSMLLGERDVPQPDAAALPAAAGATVHTEPSPSRQTTVRTEPMASSTERPAAAVEPATPPPDEASGTVAPSADGGRAPPVSTGDAAAIPAKAKKRGWLPLVAGIVILLIAIVGAGLLPSPPQQTGSETEAASADSRPVEAGNRQAEHEQQELDRARAEAEREAEQERARREQAERELAAIKAEQQAREIELARQQAEREQEAELARRQAEEKRQAELARQQAEQKRLAELARRQAEEKRQAELARQQAEERSALSANPEPVASTRVKQASEAPVAKPPDFSGTYNAEVTYADNNAVFKRWSFGNRPRLEFVLNRSQNRVTGSFSGNRSGSIEGQVQGGVLNLIWYITGGGSSTEGRGVLEVAGDGRLRGTWAHKSGDVSGQWEFERIGTAAVVQAGTAVETSAVEFSATDISGRYRAVIGGNLKRLKLDSPEVEVVLIQDGNQVDGSFEAPGGKIYGKLSGNKIKFDWLVTGDSGKGLWTIYPERGEIVGSWNNWMEDGEWRMYKVE